MTLNLLIVSHSFPPSNAPAAQRSFFFAKYLQRDCGVNVEVVTPRESMTNAGVSDWAKRHGADFHTNHTGYLPFAKSLLKSSGGALVATAAADTKLSAKALLGQFTQWLLVPDRGILWYPYGVAKASQLLRSKPEIKFLLTSSPSISDHCIALKLRQRFDIRWIADFRDFYWTGAREKTTSGSLSDRHRRLEERIVHSADACVFVTDSMREQYGQRYPEIKAKSHTICNGYDAEEFPPPRGNPGKKFRIFYSGSFYGGQRSPRPLLSALDQLLDSKHLSLDEIEVVVAGNVDGQAAAIFDEYRIRSSVKYLGQLARQDVLEEMAQADLLWLIIADLPSHSGSFPVKGYEYLGARRPILAFCPPNTAASQILTENGVYPVLSNDASVEVIKEVICKRIDHKRAGDCLVSLPGSSEKYTRFFQAKQLSTILSNMHSNRTHIQPA